MAGFKQGGHIAAETVYCALRSQQGQPPPLCQRDISTGKFITNCLEGTVCT